MATPNKKCVYFSQLESNAQSYAAQDLMAFFQERTGGQLSYTEACGVLVTSTYLFTLDGICLGENLAHRTILHENEA